MNKLKTKVFFWYDHSENWKRLTLGLAVNHENKFCLAIAECSPKDQFQRSIGRRIVTNRLQKKCGFYKEANDIPNLIGQLENCCLGTIDFNLDSPNKMKHRHFYISVDFVKKLAGLALSGKYNINE